MRDAIELEWAGIPSACIVHETLRGSANAMARLSGLPEYPFLTVDYPWIPTAFWSDAEIRELAHQIAPRVRKLLCDGVA